MKQQKEEAHFKQACKYVALYRNLWVCTDLTWVARQINAIRKEP